MRLPTCLSRHWPLATGVERGATLRLAADCVLLPCRLASSRMRMRGQCSAAEFSSRPSTRCVAVRRPLPQLSVDTSGHSAQVTRGSNPAHCLCMWCRMQRLAGCQVIGTCSSDDKAESLRKLGCHRCRTLPPLSYASPSRPSRPSRQHPAMPRSGSSSSRRRSSKHVKSSNWANALGSAEGV